jgi:hypothetical protein
MTSIAAEPMTDAAAGLQLKLLLARLLVAAKRPPTMNAVRKDLGKALGSEPSTETMQDWVDRLRAEGFLGEKLTLTDAGARHALEFLGADRVPPRTNWVAMITRYLVPRALGMNSSDASKVKKLSREDGLAGAVLKRRYGIAKTDKDSLDSVLEAVICQKLGYDVPTLKELKKRKIAELLKAEESSIPKQPKQQVRALLAANNFGELRARVLAEWVSANTSRASEATAATNIGPFDFDLDAFARTVVAAARGCPTGWFGDNKIFISHVYRHVNGEPAFSGVNLDDFKQRLVEANRNDRLTLSRADLVSVMNPDDVRESETRQLDAVFHFIVIERERP